MICHLYDGCLESYANKHELTEGRIPSLCAKARTVWEGVPGFPPDEALIVNYLPKMFDGVELLRVIE